MKGILRVTTEGGDCAFDYLFQEYLWRGIKNENIFLNRRETVCRPQSG